MTSGPPALPVSFVRAVLRTRIGQLMVNEHYKAGAFRVPIHLAFGHEALAAAVAAGMAPADQLLLSHRNIHYHLARGASLRAEIDEYLVRAEGLAGGRLGSMNLACAAHQVPYASSILGNNLSVSVGLALALQAGDGVATVVTGDGAIEEGAFYESLVLAKTLALPLIILVENNGWSLATHVSQRRCPIDLAAVAAAVGAGYATFEGADPWACLAGYARLRTMAIDSNGPVVADVPLVTLGHWTVTEPGMPGGRFVNYHAGPARTVALDAGPVLERSVDDPVFRLLQSMGDNAFAVEAAEVRRSLEGEWA